MNEIIIRCRACLEDNKVSLLEKHFICSSCGEYNEYDNEKFADQQKVIIKKVFGEKPEKPENN